jgi:hypothetical protein
MEKIKSAFHTFMVWCVVIGIIAGGIYLVGSWLGRSTEMTLKDKAPQIKKEIIERIPVIVDKKPNYEKNAEEIKQDILNDLSLGCEVESVVASGGDPDGAIIFDSNNEASVGRFMYQRDTVIAYENLFYGREVKRSEAIAISIDSVRASELAWRILTEDSENEKNGGGANNWKNCNKKHNISQRVDMWKKMTKID